MGGPVVIVFIGALIVWVVIQVVRAQQDEAANAQRRLNQPNPFRNQQPNANNNNPGNPVQAAPKTPEKSSANDIDRFLQEIDRLRQRAAQPKAEEKPAQTASQQAKPRPQPQRPAPAPAPPRPRQSAPVRTEPPRPEPIRPTLVSPPAPPPTASPSLPVFAKGTVSVDTPIKPSGAVTIGEPTAPTMNLVDRKFAETIAASPIAAAMSIIGVAPEAKADLTVRTPVATLLRQLLLHPQGRGAAMILKEIMDNPRTKWRG